MSTSRSRADRGFLAPSQVKKSEAGYRLCRTCYSECRGRYQNYCSDTCLHEWKIRSDPGYVRQKILARDKGVCASCKLDCEKLNRILQKLYRRCMTGITRKTSESRVDKIQSKYPWVVTKNFKYSGNIRSPWQADHIVPVCEGGGECGLENYRTLCTPCHKAETRALAARRAKAKREAGP